MAKLVCESVEYYCRKLAYRLVGYCLMPDHLHVLLSPNSTGTHLEVWLQLFKSYTGNRFMRATGEAKLWQRSANDHVCRGGESAEVVLRYILSNPVRANLVEFWELWPWSKAFIEI